MTNRYLHELLTNPDLTPDEEQELNRRSQLHSFINIAMNLVQAIILISGFIWIIVAGGLQ